MIYIILLLLSLFLFGPLIFVLISLFLFRKRIGVFGNFSQIYNSVYSMMQKMQRGEFQDFQRQTDSNLDPNMTRAEAFEILGLSESATKKEINTAYHKLIQKNHPDRGGSSYLAKQINKARDVLLK